MIALSNPTSSVVDADHLMYHEPSAQPPTPILPATVHYPSHLLYNIEHVYAKRCYDHKIIKIYMNYLMLKSDIDKRYSRDVLDLCDSTLQLLDDTSASISPVGLSTVSTTTSDTAICSKGDHSIYQSVASFIHTAKDIAERVAAEVNTSYAVVSNAKRTFKLNKHGGMSTYKSAEDWLNQLINRKNIMTELLQTRNKLMLSSAEVEQQMRVATSRRQICSEQSNSINENSTFKISGRDIATLQLEANETLKASLAAEEDYKSCVNDYNNLYKSLYVINGPIYNTLKSLQTLDEQRYVYLQDVLHTNKKNNKQFINDIYGTIGAYHAMLDFKIETQTLIQKLGSSLVHQPRQENDTLSESFLHINIDRHSQVTRNTIVEIEGIIRPPINAYVPYPSHTWGTTPSSETLKFSSEGPFDVGDNVDCKRL